MHDALTFGQEGEVGGCAKLCNVAVQCGDLLFADQVGDAVVTQLPPGGGRVVVGGGHDGADAPDLAACFAQAFKGLRAGDLMHQMPVDVEDGRAVFFGMNDVFIPDFVVKGASHVVSLLIFDFKGLGWTPSQPRAR